MPMREIRTAWSGPQGLAMFTVMYFDVLVATAANQRLTLETLWQGFGANLSDDYDWEVETTGRVIDEASGGLVGGWADPTARAGVGGAAQEPVPDASQILLRWTTGVVADGRFLQGRTFVPGLQRDALLGGNLNPTATTALSAVANGFATAGMGFVIWHRPTATRSGSMAAVNAGSCWSELAVQRNRRG